MTTRKSRLPRLRPRPRARLLRLLSLLQSLPSQQPRALRLPLQLRPRLLPRPRLLLRRRKKPPRTESLSSAKTSRLPTPKPRPRSELPGLLVSVYRLRSTRGSEACQASRTLWRETNQVSALESALLDRPRKRGRGNEENQEGGRDGSGARRDQSNIGVTRTDEGTAAATNSIAEEETHRMMMVPPSR